MKCDKCLFKEDCEGLKFKWLEEINCMHALDYMKVVLDSFCPIRYAMAKALDEFVTSALANLVLEELSRGSNEESDRQES